MPNGGFLALDDTVHQKTRLAILSMLREAEEVSFVFLRDGLGLTDGNLGRHLDVLLGAVASRCAASTPVVASVPGSGSPLTVSQTA
ncbi:helix-turn-helix domain-containing protein [Rhodococcus hoagii]|nr:helix-turn-helix domain-containing protein [Prescottella equi]